MHYSFFSQLEISPPFCGSQQAVITFDFSANQLAACRAQSIAAVTRDQTNQQAPRTVRSGEEGGGEIAGCASGIDRHVPKQRNQFAAAVISCAGRICHDAYFYQPLCGPGTAVGLPCECVCVRAVTVEQNDI